MAVQPFLVQKERSDSESSAKRDPIDQLLIGLQIANQGLGIVSNLNSIESAKQQRELYKNQDTAAKRQLNLEATGYKPVDTANMIRADERTPGAREVQELKGYEGDKPKIEKGYYVPKQKAAYTQKEVDELVGKGGFRYAKEGEKGAMSRSVLLPDDTIGSVLLKDTGAEKADAAAREKQLEREKDVYLKKLDLDARSEQKTVKDKAYESLTKEDKIQVDELAKGVGHRKNIINILNGNLKQYQNAKTEAQKITIGNSMIKSLNAVLGSDAVGAEEVGRLAANLKYQVANFTGPGAFVGRDLKGFEQQVIDSINGYKDANNQSLAQINEIKGIAPQSATPAATPVTRGAGPLAPGVSQQQNELVNWAMANPNDPRSAQVLQKLGINPGRK